MSEPGEKEKARMEGRKVKREGEKDGGREGGTYRVAKPGVARGAL